MEGFGGGVFFVILAFAIAVIGFFIFIAIRIIQSSVSDSEDSVPRNIRAPGRSVSGVRRGDSSALRRRANRTQHNDDQEEDIEELPEDDFQEDEENNEDEALSKGKIGAKKLKKLEMKEEKRRAREFELQEREEKKKKQEELDKLRKIEEEKEAAEEKAKEEAERLEKERKEKEEYEEYLKIKASFAIEEEGCDADFNEEETQNRLQQFIDYIKNKKVVHMDELAGYFNMRTADVISRVQDLLEQEQIIGVIDDRGKFIYITEDELSSVAKFIRQRGRVSITDLAENSNTFFNLLSVAE